ncbi:GGDEF domain-containing protein [Antrihabitans cavernicola]|uniref:GGDEF domain-containing protein n=1 Tax=Antrihabitans cavernicola TaxID=2495913 RepID=A0A5A7SE30_9NOCA|nr:GGDEF domain-containing protein [Spelaeibacter cavernicola]KAA0022873.1 GGDEF domain-containing protein [Spelaeibacter cavernicola]
MIREVRVRPIVVLGVGIGIVALAGISALPDRPAAIGAGVAQLVGGAAATWACLWTSRNQDGLQRSWRLLVALGMAGWTAGAFLWVLNRNIAGNRRPPPMLADFGYFLFAGALLAALLLFFRESMRAAGGSSERHVRAVSLIDSLVVVGSLFTLTWSTSLGSVAHWNAPSLQKHLIVLAHPIADLIIVSTVALLLLTRRVRDRFLPQLCLLGCGAVVSGLSDSALAYRVSVGRPELPPIGDLGFVLGPALIVVAAMTATGKAWVPRIRTSSERAHLLMPYGFVVLTGAVVLGRAIGGGGMDVLGTSMVWLVVVLVLVRQIVILLENKALLEQLSSAQTELAYRAHHDPLTGLANRTLLGLRLDEAMDHRRRSGQVFAVLLIDLDDFKAVNDSLGHAAGDLLLQIVGDRLRGCVRAHDTVSRLGGDEFVVVLASGGSEPRAVAQRIVSVLGEPCVVDGHVLAIKATVGVVEPGYEPGLTPEIILHRADGAMYAGKRRGKSVIVAYDASGASTLSEDTDIIPR